MSLYEIFTIIFSAKKKDGQSVRVKGGPIYLDDLNHDEPEIAELYLYSRHRTNTTYVICLLSKPSAMGVCNVQSVLSFWCI